MRYLDPKWVCTGFKESLPQKREEELIQALSQLLVCLKQHPDSNLEKILTQQNWITLTIEAEGLEDNTKTKHTVQFVYDTSLLE